MRRGILLRFLLSVYCRRLADNGLWTDLMGTKSTDIWTASDDDEFEYGRQYTFEIGTILAEEKKRLAQQEPQDVWPDWREGRPTHFRRHVYVRAFDSGTAKHQETRQLVGLELSWREAYSLDFLKKNSHRLPSTKWSSQWSGVYRLFASTTSINRCCGTDTTGTLYIGMAGTGKMSWSILATRLKEVIKSNHHAIAKWHRSKLLCERFPRTSLNIEWAYTGTRTNHAGDTSHDAALAEAWLLASYSDSFGEYPPLNEVG
jgi:hypothetical protein